MIQPGQKLKEGDYCKEVTRIQGYELMSIDGSNYPDKYEKLISENGVIYSEDAGGLFAMYAFGDPKTEHTFADFKQLCENTFGDGAN